MHNFQVNYSNIFINNELEIENKHLLKSFNTEWENLLMPIYCFIKYQDKCIMINALQASILNW